MPEPAMPHNVIEVSTESSDTAMSSRTNLDSVFIPTTKQQWIEAALAGMPVDTDIDTLSYQTLDGLRIQALYDDVEAAVCSGGGAATSPSPATEAHVSDGGERQTIKAPGTFDWDNRLSLPRFDSAAAQRLQIMTGLQGGNTSLELSVCKSTDLTALLNGVKLDIAPVHLRAGLEYAEIASRFQKAAFSAGYDPAELACTFNADPLGEWLVSGELQTPVDTALSAMADFSYQTSQTMPETRSILIDTTVHHNAGASALQELHAAIATGTAYLEVLLDAGLSVEQASRQMVFQVACDADILMGIVKLRSLRVLWNHLLTQFGASTDYAVLSRGKSPMLVVAETSRRYLSRFDHWNNHLRNIAACTAAAAGNSNAIIVHPHDRFTGWHAGEDPALGERMARNLPIILERESGLTHVDDPFAGSYAIETLTQELVELTWAALEEMGSSHDWLRSLESGHWQQAVAETQAKRANQLQAEKLVIVGVNRFVAASVKEGSDSAEQSVSNTTGHPDKSSIALNPVRDAEPFELAAIAASFNQSTQNAKTNS